MIKGFDKILQEAKDTGIYQLENARLDFTIGITDAMKKKGISKTDLAKLIGTTPAYVTKVFRGNANFTLETMVKIANSLGTKVEIKVSPVKSETTTFNFDMVKSVKKPATHRWEPEAREWEEKGISNHEAAIPA